MNVIKLHNISKVFKLYDTQFDRIKEIFNPFGKNYHKDFYALKDVSLEIKKGEKVGIIGRNGSGKSTLLKIISGITIPNSGTVELRGKLSTLLELGSGFNPYYTGYENIYFYDLVLGISKKEMDEKLPSILEFAELGEYINQPLRTYSRGMKSKLAFSVAINIDPDILILDEVFAIGDDFFKQKSLSKLEELWEKGKTIIMVSHSLSNIQTYCERAVWIHKGSIRDDGTAESVIANYKDLKHTFV